LSSSPIAEQKDSRYDRTDLRGSGQYRKLRANSKAALIGAIEIYNKPRFEYRDEVFVILLLNAWELLPEGRAVEGRTVHQLPQAPRRAVPHTRVARRAAEEHELTTRPERVRPAAAPGPVLKAHERAEVRG